MTQAGAAGGLDARTAGSDESACGWHFCAEVQPLGLPRVERKGDASVEVDQSFRKDEEILGTTDDVTYNRETDIGLHIVPCPGQALVKETLIDDIKATEEHRGAAALVVSQAGVATTGAQDEQDKIVEPRKQELLSGEQQVGIVTSAEACLDGGAVNAPTSGVTTIESSNKDASGTVQASPTKMRLEKDASNKDASGTVQASPLPGSGPCEAVAQIDSRTGTDGDAAPHTEGHLQQEKASSGCLKAHTNSNPCSDVCSSPDRAGIEGFASSEAINVWWEDRSGSQTRSGSMDSAKVKLVTYSEAQSKTKSEPKAEKSEHKFDEDLETRSRGSTEQIPDSRHAEAMAAESSRPATAAAPHVPKPAPPCAAVPMRHPAAAASVSKEVLVATSSPPASTIAVGGAPAGVVCASESKGLLPRGDRSSCGAQCAAAGAELRGEAGECREKKRRADTGLHSFRRGSEGSEDEPEVASCAGLKPGEARRDAADQCSAKQQEERLWGRVSKILAGAARSRPESTPDASRQLQKGGINARTFGFIAVDGGGGQVFFHARWQVSYSIQVSPTHYSKLPIKI